MNECVIFGGLLLDKYFEVKRLPKRGQDGFIDREFPCVGGCAINMAATFENLGGKAHVVSYLGNDEIAKEIMKYMNEHGLSLRYVKEKEGDTDYCMVFLESDGERTFLTKSGSNLDFTKDLVEDNLLNINYVAVTGYYLLNKGAEQLVETLEGFVDKGGFVLFDPSPLVGSIDKDHLKRILSLSGCITPNITEAQIMAEMLHGGDSWEEWIKQYAREGRYAVVKEGSDGGTIYVNDYKEIYKAEKRVAVDTTGAGDSFAAGILYAIADQKDIFKAVKLGCLTSAKTVTINGPHGFWEPEIDMLKLLKK